VQRPSPRQIWSLTDGHAGNVRQARALADALGLATREFVLEPHLPWRALAPWRLPGAAAAFGAGFQRLLDSTGEPPVLAIGCGRQAALATRVLRERGATAVQILDPRIASTHWDIVIAPAHDALRGANVLEMLGSLNPVDDHWLGSARAAFSEIGRFPGPRTTLLFGGPGAHLAMPSRDVDRWLATVRALVIREGGSVLATTSRRTPPGLVERVRTCLSDLPGLVWTGTVDGRNPYAALLGWADRIICTGDSVNMVSEACATGAPVYVAGVEQVRGRPARFIRALQERGRIAGLDAAPAMVNTEPLRESARIAAALRARLGLGPPVERSCRR
jgi:mitochondrial fission protein ELM1